MNWTNRILWGIYICLLLVLLPHTAWLFGRFEPDTTFGTVTGWAGGLAFEAAIAVLTHKLAVHIGATPKRLGRWKRIEYQYINAYSGGLLVSLIVSALANLAHAVEYGQSLAIFARWGIPEGVYQVSFGAVLPMVSWLFARVLSNVSESEAETDPALEAAKTELAEAKRKLREAERERSIAEAERAAAEQRFAAAGDLLAGIFAAEKRQRILAVREKWPKLPPGAIAIIAETSPGYVSDVLKETAEVVDG